MSSPNPKKLNKKELAERWHFSWPVLEVFIGGRSSVDLSTLDIENQADAKAFLKSYGFDPDHRPDQKKMHAVLIEALYFIETHLMPKEWAHGNRPPQQILLCDDISLLLVWACETKASQRRRRAWACALLKVMHTISHIDDLQRLHNLHEARQQIMGRFRQVLFRDGDGSLWFGDKQRCIEVEKVEWKHVKPRNSIILKLLHKPGNVAETIYDLLGVRIVTKKLSETLLAVKYLRQFYLVDFPNTNPSRARNTLVDTDKFKLHLETLRQMLLKGQISPRRFLEMIAEPPAPKRRGHSANPHSAANYRAIQLTCRQRIRYSNPVLSWQDKIKTLLAEEQISPAHEPLLASLLEFVSKWHRSEQCREIAVFFPFEVQILDREAALSMEKGEASHVRYKRSQVRTARRRILHEVLGLPAK